MTFSAGRGAPALLRILWTAAAGLTTGLLLLLRRWIAPLWWSPFLLLLWAAGMWWYLPRLCRSLRGTVEPTAIRFSLGVWWRREVFLPVDALRNFEVWAPPLHRLLGCRTVVLRFAGGSAWLPLLDEITVRDLMPLLEKCEETR